MLLLPTCVLTAVLATAATATTVLPGLAYSGPASNVQAAMGMHVPTTIAPAVMQPNWPAGELRLRKRAPAGIDAGDEQVDLEKRNGPKKGFFDIHGEHDPDQTIPPDVAAREPLPLWKLGKARKEYVGDAANKNTLSFLEEESLETHVHAPRRAGKVMVSHLAQKVGGHTAKLFDPDLSDNMLERLKRVPLKEKMHLQQAIYNSNIDEIRSRYKVDPPAKYHSFGPTGPSQYYDEAGHHAPSKHHGSGQPAAPHQYGPGPAAYGQHYGSGYPAPPYAGPHAPPQHHGLSSPPQTHYHQPAPTGHVQYQGPVHPAPAQHHGSSYPAPPYHPGSGYPAPPYHHGSGYPVHPYAQGPPVAAAPPHYHQPVHPGHPFRPPPGPAPGPYPTRPH